MDLTIEERLFREVFERSISLNKRLVVKYHDDDGTRVVEVHALGISSAGNLLARVWQVRGVSNDMETEGWKLIKLANVEMAWLLSEHGEAPREGYKMGDKALMTIYKQVESLQ